MELLKVANPAEVNRVLAARRAEEEQRRVRENYAAIRARCTTLAGFVREAWHVLEPGTPYIHGWHIDAVCAHLEAITFGRMLPYGNRLLVNVPPGTMKSLLISVFWPAWEWGPCNMPHLRYLSTSYSDNYVGRDTRRMRDLIQSDWYQALYGETVKLIRSGETSFANSRGGFREGVAFTAMTGGRGDRVLIDDPHSTEGAESDADRAKVTRLFRESVPSRVNHPRLSAIVVIMQRLHQDDVSGLIKKLGLPYVHLCLPMEFEPDRKCTTPFFTDPRTYKGELLFPELFDREGLANLQKPMTAYAIAGQYQQAPSPREGGLFKRSSFRRVPAVPAGARRARGWDIAATKAKAGKDPDWTAGVKIAEAEGTYYIENVVRVREEPGEVDKLIKSTAKEDAATCQITVPQDPGAAGKKQAQQHVKMLAGYTVTVVPPTGSKETRARPLASQAAVGNVCIVETGDPAKDAWIEPFLDEICVFPAASHDDQVDAASDAFSALVLPDMKGAGALELARQQMAARAAAKAAEEAAEPEPIQYAPGSVEWMMALGTRQ